MKYNREDAQRLADIFVATNFIFFTNKDTVLLWVHNSYYPSVGVTTIHSTLSKRWVMMERIEKCRITGTNQMWVTESGMDCDSTQYSGHLRKCEATVAAFYKLYDEVGSWADGPFSLWPVTEEEREEIRPQSRDLALEAYEDGHPHSVSAVRYDEEGSY